MPGPMDAQRMGLAASLAGGAPPEDQGGPDPMQEEAPEMQLLQQIMAGVQKISDQLDSLMGAGQQEQPPQGPPSVPGQ